MIAFIPAVETLICSSRVSEERSQFPAFFTYYQEAMEDEVAAIEVAAILQAYFRELLDELYLSLATKWGSTQFLQLLQLCRPLASLLHLHLHLQPTSCNGFISTQQPETIQLFILRTIFHSFGTSPTACSDTCVTQP